MHKILIGIAAVVGAVGLLMVATHGSIAAPLTNTDKGIVSWKTIPGASAYNIYYREAKVPHFNHAVRGLPGTATSFTIARLRNRASYYYEVTALDAVGKEFWKSGLLKLYKLNSSS